MHTEFGAELGQPPGGDDLELRVQRGEGKLESHLIVAVSVSSGETLEDKVVVNTP